MIKQALSRTHPPHTCWWPVALQQVLHTQKHISSSRGHSSSSTPSSSFAFAAAVSDCGNLFKAIQDVARAVQAELQGRSIDFCQLFVTTAHRSTLSHAPECLSDSLRANTPDGQPCKQPVIIGGAVQSVHARGQSICSAHGVSLLAASLPGVELLPFHVKSASLPDFTQQQWARLLQQRHFDSRSSAGADSSSNDDSSSSSSSDDGGSSSSSSSSDDSCAAIILSSPHFAEVEKLLQRLSHALPSMPVVGGVTERGAWVDTEHQYGALFCGTDVYCLGAVGCLMLGPLTMRQLMVCEHTGSKQQQQQQEAALKDLSAKLGLVGNQAGILSYCCAALPPPESSATAAVLSQLPCAGASIQGEFAGPESTWVNPPPTLRSLIKLMSKASGTGSSAPGVSCLKAEAVEVLGQPSSAKLLSYAASYAVLHHKSLQLWTD